jgi:phosphate starvation-inducible PhoH-like protein
LSQESESSSSVRVEFPDSDKLRMLCGAHQEHLKLVERRTGV